MHQRVSGHTVRLIVRALTTRTDIPAPKILAELDVTPQSLGDAEASYPKATMDAIWDRALVLSGDDGFGLSLSTILAPGMLGAVEYLFRNSGTLGEAYAQVLRFQNLLQQNTSRWTVVASPQSRVFRFELLPPVAAAARHIVEFAFASFVTIGRQVAGAPWTPSRVTFSHARGAPLPRYEDRLHVTPQFDGDANEIELSTATCAIAVEGADAQLAEIVRAYADDKKQRLDTETIADAVRRSVIEVMPRGEATLKVIATDLGVGERTLRRKLADEGTSFQVLVDEVRYDAARAYLDQRRLTTIEIALLLGFSDVSAFYRAFQRWHGASLSEYRAAQSPTR